ncbi:MAG: hypothetical protein ACPGN3_09875 [Opitutales bacterium]
MNQVSEIEKRKEWIGPVFSVLLIRAWLAMRSIQSGIEKFGTMVPVSVKADIEGKENEYGLEEIEYIKAYGFDYYQGVPAALMKKFENEPLMIDTLLKAYNYSLGPLFILLGLCVLLGFLTRLSLLGMGLLYTSLTFGLILLNQPSGVAWLAIHVILVAMMLFAVDHNRAEIGRLIPSQSKLSILRNL